MMKLMTKDKKDDLEVLEEHEASNDSSLGGSGDERQNMEKNQDELLKLTNDLIDHYDNSLNSFTQPRTFKPANNEFDQLRKRVNYLTRKKRPAISKESGDEKDLNDSVPWNMQMYQGFIEEDDRKKQAARDARIKAGKSND